jgi:hypothetical protein
MDTCRDGTSDAVMSGEASSPVIEGEPTPEPA